MAPHLVSSRCHVLTINFLYTRTVSCSSLDSKDPVHSKRSVNAQSPALLCVMLTHSIVWGSCRLPHLRTFCHTEEQRGHMVTLELIHSNWAMHWVVQDWIQDGRCGDIKSTSPQVVRQCKSLCVFCSPGLHSVVLYTYILYTYIHRECKWSQMTPFGQHGHPKAFRDVWLTTPAISSSWGVSILSLNNSPSGTLVPSQSNEQHNLLQ